MSKYIMPDAVHAEGVIPTQKDFQDNKTLHIHWASEEELLTTAPQYTAKERRLNYTSEVGYPTYETEYGKIEKPGMLPAALGSTFLAERTYNSVFHGLTDFQKVTREDNKIIFIDAESRIHGLRALQDGKQRARKDLEHDSIRNREKVLHAEPYVETAEFTKDLLWNNLAEGRLLQEYTNAISRKRDWNMGILELYSKYDKNAVDTDGIHANDGLFVQLDDAYTYYSQNVEDVDSALYGQGYYCGIHGTGTDKVALDFTKQDLNTSGNIVEQLVDMNTQYFTQQGLPGQRFLVSLEAYGQLFKLAGRRQTEWGDKLYFEGADLILNGTPINPCMELGQPRNDYKQHVLLGNFNSGVMTGMREDFDTEIFYDGNDFKWKFNTFVYFGVLLKYEQDVLAAEVEGLPTQIAQEDDGNSGNNSGDNSGNNGGDNPGDNTGGDTPSNP